MRRQASRGFHGNKTDYLDCQLKLNLVQILVAEKASLTTEHIMLKLI